LEQLQNLLMNEDCFLPSKTREISPVCQNAKLNVAKEVIRNGQDRAHRIYNTDESTCAYEAKAGEEITYTFDEAKVSAVHIVFCSDLNRDTLPGSHCERSHSTRANQRLDSPQMHMPKTLCKAFRVIGEQKGEKQVLLEVTNNRKRAYHMQVDQVFDKLTLIPISGWDDSESIPVISFDFT